MENLETSVDISKISDFKSSSESINFGNPDIKGFIGYEPSASNYIKLPLQRHPEIKGFIGYEIKDEEYFLSELRPLNELVIPSGAFWKRKDKIWKSINISLAEALVCQLNLFIPKTL